MPVRHFFLSALAAQPQHAAFGHQWLQAADAQLSGFFHQPVHGIALDGGHHQAEIGFRCWRAVLRFQRNAAAILAECRDAPSPFAILGIEDCNCIAGATAQHGAQMMRLAGLSLDLKAGGEVGFKI